MIAIRVAAAGMIASGDAVAQGRSLGWITLFSWLVSVGSGGVMLGTWIAHGGPRQQRARRYGLPPAIIFTHFGLAVTGLLLWSSYLATRERPLSWVAAILLMPVAGLGISTVTLWTPFPTRPDRPGSEPGSGLDEVRHEGAMLGSPAEDDLSRRLTDEILARALTDDDVAARLADDVLAAALSDPSRVVGKRSVGKRSVGYLSALIPVLHGMAAITTLLFTTLTVVTTLS